MFRVVQKGNIQAGIAVANNAYIAEGIFFTLQDDIELALASNAYTAEGIFTSVACKGGPMPVP